MTGPSPNDRKVKPTELLVLALLLVLHALLLRTYFVPTTGGTDANAYHVSSRMVQLHGRYHQVPEDPLVFMGKMWVLNDEGEFYPKYPPLYPALAGLSMRAIGDAVGLWINPICAVLAVLGAFVACRVFLPGWAALLGAMTAALNPVLNSLAIDQVSHAASVAFVTWSFAVFFLAVRDGERPRTGWLGLAGLLIGFAVGVRYTNVLLTAPMGVWFLLRWRREGLAGLRRVVPWLVGFSIPCLYLAWYHWSSFGSPVRTGYSLTAEQDAFSLQQFLGNLRLYVPGALTHGLGPYAVLACLGFLLLWWRDRGRALFVSAWVVPAGLLAVSYYFAPDNHPVSYMRFLLPLGLPAILLGTLLAREWVERVRPARRGACIALLFLGQAAWALPSTIDHMERRFGFNDLQARKLDFMREHIPEGSVIFGPMWNLEALDYDQAYVLYDSQLVDRDLMRGVLERSLEDVHMQRRRWEPLYELLFGQGDAGYAAQVGARIDDALATGRAVYLVGNEQVLPILQASFPGRYRGTQEARLPRLEPRSRLTSRPRIPAETPLCVSLVLTRITPAEDA